MEKRKKKLKRREEKRGKAELPYGGALSKAGERGRRPRLRQAGGAVAVPRDNCAAGPSLAEPCRAGPGRAVPGRAGPAVSGRSRALRRGGAGVGAVAPGSGAGS